MDLLYLIFIKRTDELNWKRIQHIFIVYPGAESPDVFSVHFLHAGSDIFYAKECPPNHLISDGAPLQTALDSSRRSAGPSVNLDRDTPARNFLDGSESQCSASKLNAPKGSIPMEMLKKNTTASDSQQPTTHKRVFYANVH